MIFLQAAFYGIVSAIATVAADYFTFRARCNAGDEPPAPLDVIPLDKEPLLEDYPLPKCFQDWITDKGLR